MAHHDLFSEAMTVYLGNRRVDIFCPGRAHTAGDAVVWVPDAEVMFTGDIVEYHSACYCGDGHFAGLGRHARRYRRVSIRRPSRRGAATMRWSGPKWSPPPSRARGISWPRPMRPRPGSRRGAAALKDAWDAVRAACDPKFADYAIYEHCLPFNVARAYDEARGIDTPRIWTAERDARMWAELQG
jgi:hypothetical protein